MGLFVDDAFHLPRPPLDGTLYGVYRHRVVAGFLIHRPKVGVGIQVFPAGAGGHLYLADELGEKLASLGVVGAFAAFDGCPFGMSRHVAASFRNISCKRLSDVSSG